MPALRHAACLLTLVAFCVAHAVVCAAESPAQEMACCREGHKVCGDMMSASGCCQSRDQSPDRVTPVKPSEHVPLPGPLTLVEWLIPRSGADRVIVTRRTSLKRPHDPPHLHTFSLLV